MPRCKNGTRKNRKTGECETYRKPLSKEQRATKKAAKAEAKAQEKEQQKKWKEEEYNYRLEEAREEFFEDKQDMYDSKNLLEVGIGDENELPAKRKKELASIIKKVEALEKRIIRKHRLKKNEWVGDIERITVGMMEDYRLGEFLKPEHERRRGW